MLDVQGPGPVDRLAPAQSEDDRGHGAELGALGEHRGQGLGPARIGAPGRPEQDHVVAAGQGVASAGGGPQRQPRCHPPGACLSTQPVGGARQPLGAGEHAGAPAQLPELAVALPPARLGGDEVRARLRRGPACGEDRGDDRAGDRVGAEHGRRRAGDRSGGPLALGELGTQRGDAVLERRGGRFDAGPQLDLVGRCGSGRAIH